MLIRSYGFAIQKVFFVIAVRFVLQLNALRKCPFLAIYIFLVIMK